MKRVTTIVAARATSILFMDGGIKALQEANSAGADDCFATDYKARELKRMSQLKGLTISDVKHHKSGVTCFYTYCGATLLFDGDGDVISSRNLAADEMLFFGFLTKEDLASIAKAKKLGYLVVGETLTSEV